jgi:hypothetical protein
MGLTVLRRWVREFAAGVHAGNAIRLGLPVPGAALREGIVRDAAARDEYAGSGRPAGAAQSAPASPCRRRDHAPAPEDVAATDPGQRGRISTSRGRA